MIKAPGGDVNVLLNPCADRVIVQCLWQGNVVDARAMVTIRGDIRIVNCPSMVLRESRRNKKVLINQPLMKGSTCFVPFASM